MMRLIALVILLASPALAVEPSEMLDDPILEARARELSSGLRCPVCRNESIDESNASLSKDLRIILRERLVAGDSDAQAVDYLVQRYGEYVLLKPNTQGANRLLWAAGPLMLLMALWIGWVTIRRRGQTGETGLDQKEQARLDKILND
ncbi:MAG: cytochrome c-type biogenesis protein CcmH [Yoonia sp.]|nr:cytochrome c-type biogenesis protein CcmH [Yoonia sp.]